MAEEKVRTEEFQVKGEEIVSKIKELLHEGNIRRVIIKNEAGRTLIDIPLTLVWLVHCSLPNWLPLAPSRLCSRTAQSSSKKWKLDLIY